jgi:DNA-directed RNA polymerase specialized sigma24 family protein
MVYVAASGTIVPDQLYDLSADDYHRQVTATIERIVNMKRHTFVGGMYESDDLAQELRMRLIRATASLQQGKSVFVFLVRCADNLILDMWRGIYRANNPPCRKCASGTPCQPDGKKCKRALEYEAVMRRRRNLDRPDPLGDVELLHFDTVWEELLATELKDRIVSALPTYLLKSFHDMINSGGTGVPANHKRKIREIAKGVIDGQKDD